VNRSTDLYTPEQRIRRDQTRWTLVQGGLAPLQFFVFLVSVLLIFRFLITGHGESAATISILIKTFLLYMIMITGAIWERVVFGQYLFAKAFFWEDVVSMLVIALHTLYVVALLTGVGTHTLMWIALAAYASYVINALQFVIKFRAARLCAKSVSKATAETKKKRRFVETEQLIFCDDPVSIIRLGISLMSRGRIGAG